MSTPEALRALVAIGIIIFLLRPVRGMLIDVVKIMLRLLLTAAIVQIVPLDMIDSWSRSAVGWFQISSKYVPVLALFALVASSTVNVSFLSGKVEQYLRIAIYIIGGVFTLGSTDWMDMARGLSDVTSGLLSLILNMLLVFVHLFAPGA